VIAGGFHGLDQIRFADLRAVFDVCLLDGEVHRRVHTVQPVEAALDLGRAGCAAHAAQLEVGR
jgi:hypothetical protein